MADLHPLGRAVLILGLVTCGVGAWLLYGPKLPWLGRLPGDIMIRRESFSFYIPLTSSLVVSLLVSLVLLIIARFRG